MFAIAIQIPFSIHDKTNDKTSGAFSVSKQKKMYRVITCHFHGKNTQQHENKRTSKTNKEIIIGKIATSKTNQMKTTMMAFLCHHINISGIKQ